jgi:hypothetical protein
MKPDGPHLPMASRPIAANSANELGLGAQENQCSTEIGNQ